MCKFIAYVVLDGPYANGPLVAVTRCETHEWDFGNSPVSGELCPLGRIERATEEGLEKIAFALSKEQSERQFQGQ